MRRTPVIRLIRLAQMLSSTRCGYTIPQLSKHLEAGPRTIYRDLDALEILGVSIHRTQIPHSKYKRVHIDPQQWLHALTTRH